MSNATETHIIVRWYKLSLKVSSASIDRLWAWYRSQSKGKENGQKKCGNQCLFPSLFSTRSPVEDSQLNKRGSCVFHNGTRTNKQCCWHTISRQTVLASRVLYENSSHVWHTKMNGTVRWWRIHSNSWNIRKKKMRCAVNRGLAKEVRTDHFFSEEEKTCLRKPLLSKGL